MPNCEQRKSKYKTYDNCMAYVDAHRSELDVPYEMAICAQCFGLIPSSKNIARSEMGDTEYGGTAMPWLVEAKEHWSLALLGTKDISTFLASNMKDLLGLNKAAAALDKAGDEVEKVKEAVKAVATSPMVFIALGIAALYIGSKYIGKSKQHLGIKQFIPQTIKEGAAKLARRDIPLPTREELKELGVSAAAFAKDAKEAGLKVIRGGKEYTKVSPKIAANRRKRR